MNGKKKRTNRQEKKRQEYAYDKVNISVNMFFLEISDYDENQREDGD